MATLNSWEDLWKYFQSRQKVVEKETARVVKDIEITVKTWLKLLHGHQLPWFPKQTSETPLVKEWKLKNAIVWSSSSKKWEVTTSDQRLAKIQEYGKLIKMTEKQRKYLFAVIFKWKKLLEKRSWSPKWYIYIPPRPLWRYAKNNLHNDWVRLAIGDFKKNIFKK